VDTVLNSCSRLAVVACAVAFLGQAPVGKGAPREWTFKSLAGLKVVNATAEMKTYRGRPAVHLVPAPDRQTTDAMRAILDDSDFANGTIEADVAGAPRSDAPPDARGFVGIAFHVQPDQSRYENVYVRPTNGRADDQVRRNHSVQYTSEPDFPWPRLRRESPEKYESYTDLETGAWTAIKIVVSGKRAQVFVNGAPQPCLVVNDLKLDATQGPIALWAERTTEAYFSRVVLRTE
jgi:3-keto-disaccharide hydrolase